MGIRKAGQWRAAMGKLDRLGAKSEVILRRAVLQEAHVLRAMIVEGLTKQAPGGKSLKPIARLTRANRRFQRFFGSKALLVRGDLRNGIAVVAKRKAAFVGVLRNAVSQQGEGLVDLARVHEFGTEPVIVPVTPAMRRYLHAMLKQAGAAAPSPRHGKAEVVVIQVPPRPFLRPAFKAFLSQAPQRFAERILKGVLGDCSH